MTSALTEKTAQTTPIAECPNPGTKGANDD